MFDTSYSLILNWFTSFLICIIISQSENNFFIKSTSISDVTQEFIVSMTPLISLTKFSFMSSSLLSSSILSSSIFSFPKYFSIIFLISLLKPLMYTFICFFLFNNSINFSLFKSSDFSSSSNSIFSLIFSNSLSSFVFFNSLIISCKYLSSFACSLIDSKNEFKSIFSLIKTLISLIKDFSSLILIFSSYLFFKHFTNLSNNFGVSLNDLNIELKKQFPSVNDLYFVKSLYDEPSSSSISSSSLSSSKISES